MHAAPPVFRFAPSPNGYLHLGHAYSALLNFEAARATGGRFLLRIEDIDAARCRPHFEAAIYDDLHWLGVNWEEPVRRQSDHLPLYAQALQKLDAVGLIYRSYESRAEIAAYVGEQETRAPWPRDPDGAPLYPGAGAVLDEDERARREALGAPYALRLNMAAALRIGADKAGGDLFWREANEAQGAGVREVRAEPQEWGDVILARKETPTSYHLSVVVDDALQGVTHVVRGQDLAQSTAIHRLLQCLLGLPEPTYHHHRLILDDESRKLAKSTGAVALRDLRAQGASAADIMRRIGL